LNPSDPFDKFKRIEAFVRANVRAVVSHFYVTAIGRKSRDEDEKDNSGIDAHQQLPRVV
jgi:hypothetical protein